MIETILDPARELWTMNQGGGKAPDVQIHEDLTDADSKDASPEPRSGALVTYDLKTRYLISSPYSDIRNQLKVSELDLPDRLLAFALTHLQTTRPDYATAPYTESFDWQTVFASLQQLSAQVGVRWVKREFYVVIFRSQLLADADRTRLGMLDQKSHEEACASGGLLKYWFGSPNAECRNLATCLWRNREDAAAGGKGPWHRKARMAAREMYEEFSFHTYRMVIEDDVRSWRLEEYVA